jgi:phage terminase small subunit
MSFARGVALGQTPTAAARDAGYSKSYANRQAKQLLDNPQVLKYLLEVNQKAAAPEVATIKERRMWWSKVMRGELETPSAKRKRVKAIELKLRLKASELLGRSQGDFVHRHEVTGPAGGPIETVSRVEFYIPKNDRDRP